MALATEQPSGEQVAPSGRRCAGCFDAAALQALGVGLAHFSLDDELTCSTPAYRELTKLFPPLLSVRKLAVAGHKELPAQRGAREQVVLLPWDQRQEQFLRVYISREAHGDIERFSVGADPVVSSKRALLAAEDVYPRARKLHGLSFADEVIRHTARTLGLDAVLLVEATVSDNTATVLSGFDSRGERVALREYPLRGSPCEQVLHERPCSIDRSIQELYPDDVLLTEMRAQSFVGVPLTVEGTLPIGVMAAVHSEPLDARRLHDIESLLRIHAPRLASALKQVQIERDLRTKDVWIRGSQYLAPIGIWSWDLELGVMRGSDEALAIQGLDPGGELRIDDFIEMVDPSQRERTRQIVREAVAAGQAYDIEVDVTINGEVKTLRSHGEPDPEAGARIYRGSVQDLTAIRRAEDRLRLLDLAVRQAADYVAICDVDGTIRFANDSLARDLSMPSEALIGRNVKEFSPAPADLADLGEAIRRGEVMYAMERFATPQRGERVVKLTMTPVRDATGRLSGVLGLGRDVTVEIEAEEAQRRLNELTARAASEWVSTADAIQALIVVVGRDGRVERMNRAAAEALGSPDFDAVGELLANREGEPWRTAIELAGETFRTGRTSGRKVAGGRNAATWEISVTLADQRASSSAIIVLNDISAREELERSIRQSERLSELGRLVSGVAHEVRNPLFGISATLDAFEARFKGEERFLRYSAVLRDEIDRMSRLMEDLLEYGRPHTLERRRCLVSAVLDDAIAQIAPQAASAGVTIVAKGDGRASFIDVDQRRFVQVISNLVNNATQYSPRGSVIEVRAEAGDLHLEISVSDEGPGFTPSEVGRVFEPFYSKRRGGTGLGLSIVQRIVHEHGGKVEAANRPEGGARVTVRLPISEPGDE